LASAVVKAADTSAASNVFMLPNIGPQNTFSGKYWPRRAAHWHTGRASLTGLLMIPFRFYRGGTSRGTNAAILVQLGSAAVTTRGETRRFSRAIR
jgi:hypothetical protein